MLPFSVRVATTLVGLLFPGCLATTKETSIIFSRINVYLHFLTTMDARKPSLWHLALIIVFLAFILNFSLKWWWTLHGIVVSPLAEYDFIIVGGGTAGCVLARRLWEGGNYSILVVEPGNTAPFISSVPLLAPALQGYSSDWAYKTVPQEESHFGMKSRRSSWPRGKVLGGSSVLNFMIHMWGTKIDFNEMWSSIGQEWRFENVQQYYQKMENYHGSYVSDLRGTEGPMIVEELNFSSPLASAFIEGAVKMGIRKGDLNGEFDDGVMLTQSNIFQGSRISAFDAYLQPVLKYANIQLLVNSIVTKVIFKENVAVAVDTSDLHSKVIHRIRAKKEIILCAGVIGTPQILMLSGIGPAEHLEELKLPVLVNLPGVGKNLHDHLNVPMYFHLDSPVSITAKKVKSITEIFQYLLKGKGYLAHSGVEVITRLPVPEEKSNIPKMYFMVFRLGSVDETVFTNIANFKKDTFDKTFPDSKNDSKEGFLIMVSCTHPLSRGTVLLNSKNFEDYPRIDPKYLKNKEDIQCLIKAMKMAAKLGTSEPLLSMGSRLHLPAYKTCSEFNKSVDDDNYLECWLRTSALTGYHPLGTCSMGRDDDELAVLDSGMNVRGVKNLKVVDGSAFPHPVAANPHASVLMMAEKAAENILKREKEKSETF